MTAEVVLMNKQGVAMAADSAATTGNKIFNSNNKLFMLSKRHPIGIMVYGSAEIMGYPWETIIKMYRKKIGSKSFPTLHEQVEDFLNHLCSLSLFDEQVEKIYIETAFDSVARDIHNQILRFFPDPKEAQKDLLEWYFAKTVSDIKQELKHDLIEHGVSDSEKTELLDKYKNFSDDLISKYFGKYGLDEEIYNDIRLIMERTIFNNPDKYMGSSGLVFSGFGDSEIFPVTESFIVSSILKAKIIMGTRITDKINTDNISVIRPFAQSETVASFIYGIDPNLSCEIKTQIAGMLSEIPSMLSGISSEDNSILGNNLSRMCESFFNNMDDYLDAKYGFPIMRGVSSMPPSELAAMAETLVNLTSFKRKISDNQRETVGGPTDVAVITKGDGFIWINRKHYFSDDKNHHFFSNYHFEEQTHE